MKISMMIKKSMISITAILLGFMILATAIGVANKGPISGFFGSKTYDVIKGEQTEDTEYFKSQFNSVGELLEEGLKTVELVMKEGATLIKNDNNALPLQDGKRKVSLFSISSVYPAYAGKGSAQTTVPGPATTMKAGFEKAGMTVNDKLWDFYGSKTSEKYQRSGRGTSAKINDAPWTDLTADAGVLGSFDSFGDAAIFTISRPGGGEGSDLGQTGTDGQNGNYLSLSNNEISVLKGLAALKGTKFSKIIVLLNSANQVQADYLFNSEYKIDAALWMGTVGQTGLNAVGEILTGKASPSGRLSDMFWTDHSLNPVHTNYGTAYTYSNRKDFDLPEPTARKGDQFGTYVVYQEGIYQGYRYAETRYEDIVMGSDKAGTFKYSDVVAYPFGYGQSYTTFEYSNMKVSKNNRIYTVSVDVANTGSSYSGKEVVQVYVQKPYTAYAKTNGIEKAAVELVGYGKTDIIKPGAKETISIQVDEKYFTSYDANGAKTYIIDSGDHHLAVGKDAHDALNNILAKKGYTTAKGMDKAGKADLVRTYKLNFNSKAYAFNDKTNKKISNLFDSADINKYEGRGDNSVKYMTRSDWAGTVIFGADKYVKLKMTQKQADEVMAQENAKGIKGDDKAYPTYGVAAGLVLADMRVDTDGNKIEYDNPSWDIFLDQLTWDETADFLSTGYRKTGPIESIAKPETVDHNGPSGIVESYAKYTWSMANNKNDPDKGKSPPYYPSIGILAASFNDEVAKKFGEMLGEDALWSGISGFYGIGMNAHRSPYSGRAYEYYSEDPFLMGAIASVQVKALQAKGLNAYIKHLALNDQETQRSGISVWANEQTLREISFRPFEMTITDANAMNAMASFSRIGTKHIPASKELMTDFLRTECGMEGLIVTDMYSIGYSQSQLPVLLMAGNTIPDGDFKDTKVFDQFKTGYSNVAWTMREAAKRVLYSSAQTNIMNGFDSNTRIKMITPDWLIVVIVVDVVAGVLFLGAVAIAVVDFVRNKNKKKA